MDVILLVPVMISFLISIIFLPSWIKKAHAIHLAWPDMNKAPHGKVAGSGGIIASLGFIFGVLIFIAYRTFIVQTNDFLVETLAMLSSVIFLSSIGLIDDLLGWQRGGLRRRHRIVLVAMAAIPLMAINAGKSQIFTPFLGSLDLGIWYPLIVIPLGIIGATTTFNFLAGFNGLEAGQGVLLLSGIATVAFLTGNTWIAVIALCMIAALLGFLIFNFYPASVFPGDSLTYAVGGLVAILPILGNFERIAVFFFIPYIIEFLLKSRGGLVKHSFGMPREDGTLDLKYDKMYSLNHVSILLMKKFGIVATEKKVVYSIWFLQAIIIVLGLLIFRQSIFLT